jgi:hypothetical protein
MPHGPLTPLIDEGVAGLLNVVTFPELLRAYVTMRRDHAMVGTRSVLACNIVITFGARLLDFDEYVAIVADVLAESPELEDVLAEELLLPMEADGMSLSDSPSLVGFSEKVLEMVLFPMDQRMYFFQHCRHFDEPMTDEQIDLADVLLEDWPGTLTALIETTRLLRPRVKMLA